MRTAARVAGSCAGRRPLAAPRPAPGSSSTPGASRPILAEHGGVRRRGSPRWRARAQASSSDAAPGAVLAAATLATSLLLPGAALADPGRLTQAPQASPPVAAVVQQQQQEPPPAAEASPFAGFQLAAGDLSAAPDLVTDMDVEAAAAFALPPGSVESALVNGLEWMVEEGVSNFTESNFAAVGAPSSSMWLSTSPWCLVWDAYCNVLTTRPVATKLVTGMVGTFLGDLLAQATQGLVHTTSNAVSTVRGRGSAARRQDGASGTSGASGASSGGFALDLTRTARLVGFSALVGTPVAFVWFSLLDQYVLPTDPTSPLAVFSKVALDQVLMAPCMTAMFFATMAFLEGCRSQQVIAGSVKAKLRPTLLANWTVWPLAHVINFALVPPAQRILYINVVNIAWTAFMSHMASSSSSEAAPAGRSSSTASSSGGASARHKQLQQAGR